MRQGAFDYLLKLVSAAPLLDRVRRALASDLSIRAALLHRQDAEERFALLTDRERIRGTSPDPVSLHRLTEPSPG